MSRCWYYAMRRAGSEMGKPAIYLRVSSADQRERQSIQSQEQVMLAWLKAQGREPDSVHWYRDDGVSGRAPIITRGEGAQLAQAIRDGTVTGYVAVYSVSRISRAAADYFQFRELLQAHSVEFIGVSEGVDSRSEGGDLTAGLLAVISEEQVRSMLRSIRAGHERAARDGRWQGQAPFGYRVVEGRLQIHEPDAAIVREMFQRYADGDGAHVLSLWLEDSAIPAPRGGARWPLATVIRLLRNPVYIGKAQYNKRKNIRTAGRVTGHAPRDPDEYIVIDTPPLIDNATWERVQQRQATRRRQHGIKGHAYAETLIPRVYCVECGARCYAAKHSGTGKMYYQHERRFPDKYGDCRAVGAIPAPRLDSKVWALVEQGIASPESWLEARKQSRAQSGQEQERAELARLEDAIAEARKGLERLDDAYIRLGVLSAERYQRQATELGARLERLTARHSDLLERATSTEQQDEADRRRAARLASYPLPTSPTHEQKRAAVDALIDHVKVRDGSPLYVEIEWRV